MVTFMYMYAGAYTCVCMCVWRIEFEVSCLPLLLSTLFFETGSLNMEFTGLAGLAGVRALRVLMSLSLLPQC